MRTSIPVPDGTIDGYLAVPQPESSGPPPWPAVVIVHDALGLGEDTKEHAERFAASGLLALAPNLYTRGGVRCVKSVFQTMLAGSGRAFDDLSAARGLLAAREDCTGKVGVVGFCMGGGFALVAAAKGFDASAPYYGQLPAELSVLDEACPIVASFGRRDPMLKGAAARLSAALAERDVPHDVKEYPDAGHSFANRIAPGPLNVLARVGGFNHHRESQEDAWRRVRAFFATHLSQRPSSG